VNEEPAPRLSLRRLVNPTDRQNEFLRAIADYDFVLYGGEGGGGKSYILRWWLVLYLIWCFKALGLRNVRVGLFAIDYPMLLDRQIIKIQTEFPRWLGTLKKTETWNFTLRPEYGGGSIALRNLDKPAKYKSAEFAAIAVEELTEVSLKTFNDLRWRIRWPGIKRRPFAGATNPGGVGHTWVKNYWILKKYPKELEAKRDQFVFVRAKASDNPHIDEDYHADLLTLPPDMARMVGRGDWNVFTGQYFPQFEDKPGRDVLTAAEAIARVRPWHHRWISGDWGYDHPACFHWHAKDETNHVITYDELWDRRVGEKEWGERITEREKKWRERWPNHRPLGSFPFSWDAGKLSPRSRPKYPRSIIQLVTDHLGDGIPPPHPADSSPGSRMSGYRLMSQLLDANLWQISDQCSKLIECLPALIRDENDKEQVLKVDFAEGDTIGDDPADSARMGLQNEFGSSVVPVTVAADRRVAAYAEARGQQVEDLDINSIHMLHRQAMTREQALRKRRRGGRGRIWRPRG
jgi:hypothetical protein